jgi:hypothetical protein
MRAKLKMSVDAGVDAEPSSGIRPGRLDEEAASIAVLKKPPQTDGHLLWRTGFTKQAISLVINQLLNGVDG